MKKYISSGSWFSFEYPDAWHEFEDEPGSFLFYNPTSWTGNFRISAMMDASPAYAREIMQNELKEYADASRQTIGGRDFIHSSESFCENDASYTSHFWVTGEKQMVIYVTFTLPEGEKIDEVLKVLSTLRVFPPDNKLCHEVIFPRLMEIAVVNESFEWIQKEVKKSLKKDFSSATIPASIAFMQQLYDEDSLKKQPVVFERIGRVLGCFLVSEMDGVEWVTVIDGKKEEPMLYFHGNDSEWPAPSLPLKEVKQSLVDPAKFVIEQFSADSRLDFSKLYKQLVENC